jgi:hypothetical protein
MSINAEKAADTKLRPLSLNHGLFFHCLRTWSAKVYHHWL